MLWGARRRRVAAGVAASASLLFVSPPIADVATSTPAAPVFSADSPFNHVIGADPRLDVDGPAMIASMSRTGLLYANLYAYAIPVYHADGATPRRSVTCAYEGAWGACPLGGLRPIPDGAAPNSGSDGVLTVIDTVTGEVDEYWQARRHGSTWTTAWGAVNELSGSGWGGASTGAGASRLGGVVRVAEIEAGRIEHAMVLQTDNVCAGAVRPPALKTDGDSDRPDCVPEGARVQLDPDLDVDALPDLTPGERTVATAMQTYGAYVIDRGGSSLGMSFELAPDAFSGYPGAVYTRAGMTHDYYGMPHVPWNRLRVLRSWRQ